MQKRDKKAKGDKKGGIKMGFKIEGNKIVIDFDPNSTVLSRSGKTVMLASSSGFVWKRDGEKGEIGVSYNIVRRRE